jgi:hypothetical protein
MSVIAAPDDSLAIFLTHDLADAVPRNDDSAHGRPAFEP